MCNSVQRLNARNTNILDDHIADLKNKVSNENSANLKNCSENLKSHPVQLDSIKDLESHPIQSESINPFEKDNFSSALQDQTKPKNVIVELKPPFSREPALKHGMSIVENSDSTVENINSLSEIEKGEISQRLRLTDCEPEVDHWLEKVIDGGPEFIEALKEQAREHLEMFYQLASIAFTFITIKRYFDVFKTSPKALIPVLLKSMISPSVPLELKLINGFAKMFTRLFPKIVIPRIMRNPKPIPRHIYALPKSENTTQSNSNKKTKRTKNTSEQTKQTNIKKTETVISKKPVEKDNLMFQKQIKVFLTNVASEAKKHEIMFPKKIKQLKSLADCYDFVHHLALQNSNFKVEENKLNAKGITFKRNLLNSLFTSSNPWLKPQPYQPFYNLSQEKQNQYLAGLIEGDGCFSQESSTKKDGGNARLTIAYNKSERLQIINVAEGLTSGMSQKEAADYGLRFNDSKIYNQGNLVIRKKALIDVLCRIYNQLIGTAKIEQIKKLGLDKLVNLSFKPLASIQSDNLWLSGFMDSDGTIYYDEKQKVWFIEFSQNSKQNPLLISKICDLIPTSNGTIQLKKEGMEKVGYSLGTSCVWLELLQNQCLQSPKHFKQEQMKKHYKTFLNQDLQKAHNKSIDWLNRIIPIINDYKKIKPLYNRPELDLMLNKWKLSYDFSTAVLTEEKKTLALSLREQGWTIQAIADFSAINVSSSHMQRFLSNPVKASDKILKEKGIAEPTLRAEAFMKLTLKQMQTIDKRLDQNIISKKIGEEIGVDRRVIGSYKNSADWSKKLAQEFEKAFPNNINDQKLKKEFKKKKT